MAQQAGSKLKTAKVVRRDTKIDRTGEVSTWQCIEQAEVLLKTKVMAESDLDGEESNTDYFINRLSTNSLLLERCNRDWSNVIKDTKGEG